MEVIELSSEAEESVINGRNEVIILSEDHGTSSEPEPMAKEAAPASNPRGNEKQSLQRAEDWSSPEKNVLDLHNWISSSEDDSFVRDLLQTSQNARVAESPPRKRRALCSSPILEPIPEQFAAVESMEVLSPSRSRNSKSSQATSVRSDKANNRKRAATDEIENCPLTSSPPAKPASKRKKAASDVEKRWREANKATRKKSEIMAEMVIEISVCLKETIQSEYFTTVFDLPVVRSSYLDVPLISWKRRVEAQYDRTRDVFVPCDLTELSERILALYYSPEDLVTKIQEDALKEDISVAKAKAQAEDPGLNYYIVLLVPGFQEYLRKLKSNEDKHYREAMLSQLNASQRRSTQSEQNITVNEVTTLTTQVEVDLGVNIFFTKSHEETVDWLYSFTYTIGSSLYDKFERNPTFAGVGSTKSGADQRTSYLEMIKKFNMMTAPKAEKLFQFYASAASLYKRFMEHDNLGTVNGKGIVPPTVNNSMRRVFTATDPNQIIAD